MKSFFHLSILAITLVAGQAVAGGDHEQGSNHGHGAKGADHEPQTKAFYGDDAKKATSKEQHGHGHDGPERHGDDGAMSHSDSGKAHDESMGHAEDDGKEEQHGHDH